jgi:hypothetical protein
VVVPSEADPAAEGGGRSEFPEEGKKREGTELANAEAERGGEDAGFADPGDRGAGSVGTAVYRGKWSNLPPVIAWRKSSTKD